MNLCRCNNCNELLIDHNPQVDAVDFDFEGIWRLKQLTLISISEELVWSCPNCKTDEYLIDIDWDNITTQEIETLETI